jgi:hypothetical protein
MAATSEHWSNLAKRHIKAELKRADVGYADLAKRLTDMGLPETDSSIAMKINRGAFPAWFLFATMHAIGAHTLRLE